MEGNEEERKDFVHEFAAKSAADYDSIVVGGKENVRRKGSLLILIYRINPCLLGLSLHYHYPANETSSNQPNVR